MVVETYSERETWNIARQMGRKARPGDIICLNGDLGVGKTAFAKGFAEGMGVIEPVVSPTFTIVQEYEGKDLPLYHFDVYRIADIGEMDEIGADDYFYGDGVCIIEWSEFIEELIPDGACHVTIEKDLKKGLDYRKVLIGDNPRTEVVQERGDCPL